MVQPRPASTGVVSEVELVAVQAQGRLEPERVAGAEAGRRDLGLREQPSRSAGASVAATEISKPSSPV